MEKVKLIYFLFFEAFLLYSVCVVQGCDKRLQSSGEIIEFSNSGNNETKCWTIIVPEDMYAELNVKEKSFQEKNCSISYVQIEITGTEESFTLCYEDEPPSTIIALSDINITFVYGGGYKTTWFTIRYTLEQGLFAVKGVNASLKKGVEWLKGQRSFNFMWGRETPRGITALYLAGNASFRGDNIEEQLFLKQLQLQILIALFRNSSSPVLVSDLTMFINALTVTCHNSSRFNGYDLLKILSEQTAASKFPNPGAYLALCNANWTLSKSDVQDLTSILYKQFENTINLDIQAMAVMALSCIKDKTKGLDSIQNAIYETTIKEFINNQRPDGSFGNAYTTALVTQALLSSQQEKNEHWKLSSTVKFLMQKLNSSPDFLLTYLVLPILNGKTFADLSKIKCGYYRGILEDDILDAKNKVNGTLNLQYSLYFGNQKDVIRTISLRMKANSSAYEVMWMAQMVDNKLYRFLYSDELGYKFVYGIDGIINDSEAGNFWFIYTENPLKNNTIRKRAESLDKIIVEDGDHLIMWYKNVHIG